MKRFSFASILVVCWSLCSLAAFAQDKSTKIDPSGTWRWEYELDGQSVKDLVRLSVGKDGAMVGSYVGRSEKPTAIKEGKIDGDTLKFQLLLDLRGTSIKAEFRGKIKGDDIDGNVTLTTPDGTNDFDWKPKRSVEMEDVVGLWQIKIETGDNTLEPTLEVTKTGDQYQGRYKSGDQINVMVSNLKVEKNQLKFRIEAEVSGRKIKGDYAGRPFGDKMNGSIAYDLDGNTGEIDFTSVRKPNDK
ncbi:MAG: hypothetical protein ABL921_18325 [Pirellula sp.]